FHGKRQAGEDIGGGVQRGAVDRDGGTGSEIGLVIGGAYHAGSGNDRRIGVGEVHGGGFRGREAPIRFGGGQRCGNSTDKVSWVPYSSPYTVGVAGGQEGDEVILVGKTDDDGAAEHRLAAAIVDPRLHGLRPSDTYEGDVVDLLEDGIQGGGGALGS